MAVLPKLLNSDLSQGPMFSALSALVDLKNPFHGGTLGGTAEKNKLQLRRWSFFVLHLNSSVISSLVRRSMSCWLSLKNQ